MRKWIREHPRLALAGGIGAVAFVIFVLVWFEPQKLFIDERVDEELEGFSAAVATTQVTTTTAAPTTTAPTTLPPDDGATTTTAAPTTTLPPTTTTTTTTQPPGPVVLHQSELQSPGKAGSGDVFLIELEDGSRIIRFENLDVSNGPDLRVILSRSGLVDDRDAYHLDGFYDLGELKGNQGNQNYEVPDDVDLSEYLTVAIFCLRFNYTFNAATIS